MSGEKKSGFGGILKKLGDLALKPEYIESDEVQPEEQVPASAVQNPVQQSQSTRTVFAKAGPVPFTPVANATITINSATPTQEDIKATVEKIYKYLESINKPGVDFLEFWNAVEAMDGGVTVQNIKNAFVAIRMMSGNTVTKELLVSTGNEYVVDLTNAINADIKKKEDVKVRLGTELSNEKSNLETEVLSLQTQIETLQKQLGTKQTALAQINDKYAPKMQEADKAISCGNTSLKIVLDEMNQFISLIGTTIQ